MSRYDASCPDTPEWRHRRTLQIARGACRLLLMESESKEVPIELAYEELLRVAIAGLEELMEQFPRPDSAPVQRSPRDTHVSRRSPTTVHAATAEPQQSQPAPNPKPASVKRKCRVFD